VQFTRVRRRRAAGNADTNRVHLRIFKVLQNPSAYFRSPAWALATRT
jgi:hypothetical protein